MVCGWCGDELNRGARSRIHRGESPEYGLCDTCGDAWEDNPPAELLGLNPDPADDLTQFGTEVYEIRYRHSGDGKNYRHEFGPGVELWALPGGSVLVKHSDPNKRVWDDFSN